MKTSSFSVTSKPVPNLQVLLFVINRKLESLFLSSFSLRITIMWIESDVNCTWSINDHNAHVRARQFVCKWTSQTPVPSFMATSAVSVQTVITSHLESHQRLSNSSLPPRLGLIQITPETRDNPHLTAPCASKGCLLKISYNLPTSC